MDETESLVWFLVSELWNKFTNLCVQPLPSKTKLIITNNAAREIILFCISSFEILFKPSGRQLGNFL